MARRSRHSLAGQAHSQRILLIALTIVALLLLTSGQIYQSIYHSIRGTALSITSPLIQLVNRPFGFFGNLAQDIRDFHSLEQQYLDLQFQKRQASYWESYTRQLLKENQELRARWSVPDDFPALPGNFITARVIADLSGTFIDSLLINAGHENNIQTNDIVLDNGYLVGRVIDVRANYSRVLLLTDINSRIPIVIGPESVRAILAGNNSDFPDLFFPLLDAALTEHMKVTTSGHGGVFPAGLPVGKIHSRDNDTIKIIPQVNMKALKYVDILNFHRQIIPQENSVTITDSYQEATD